MKPVRQVRTVWVMVGLLLGYAVVIAGPAMLVWNALSAQKWSERTLKAEFQSIRYESGGLVFRYTVHNLTRHTAEFQPGLAELHAIQAKDEAPVGYPNITLPLSVPAHGLHVVEVRLELRTVTQGPSSLSSEEHTQRVIESPPPGAPLYPDAPVSPLPMHQVPRKAPEPAPTVESSLQNALSDLNGFELVDETNGIRLVLPRG